MDISLLFYSSSSESEEEHNLNIIRKRIRASSDPLSLPPASFKQRFRLSKEAFSYVLSNIEFKVCMSTYTPPVLQLAATLTLLASGSFQYNVGNDFILGLSQRSMCRIINHVVNEMELILCPKEIQFGPEQSTACMQSFMEKYNIPGVVGCVDGTHFGLQRPPKNEHMFFNRKGFHSLNAMIICDHEYKILSINSKYGGAAHDSFVWKHCDERNMLSELYTNHNLKNVWLLGDSGYPLEPWCITPYRTPADGSAEAHFNEVHSKARCIVERTIGILKIRWKILSNDKRSRYTPEKIARFANVCSVLHNICIKCEVPMYTSHQNNDSEPSSVEIDIGNETRLTKIGEKIRNQIKIALP